MAITTLHHVAWQRFHDPKAKPIRPNVKDVHCANAVRDFIDLCHNRRATGLKLKAAGSHWSLSKGTLSDDAALETHWPGAGSVPLNAGLVVQSPASHLMDLADLINDATFDFMVNHPPALPENLPFDPCLNQGLSQCFFVHVKSGTRIYEAYSLLDGMKNNPTRLAKNLNKKIKGTTDGPYDGPWAFATLGGAGGQTVFGALTTGTHGGDFRQRPISDSVVAVHLVTDGGDHFWIEPASSQLEHQLTDDVKLENAYGGISSNGKFKIIRDNDIFDSVVVGVGRFGVVVSLVLRVVPQYCLLQHRYLGDWSAIKPVLKGPSRHFGFNAPFFSGADAATDKAEFDKNFNVDPESNNRFLQIAINTCSHKNDEHRCGVTQRWFRAVNSPHAVDPSGNVHGRKERGDPSVAGKSSPYEPPDAIDGSGSNSTFLSRACSDGNFIGGIVRELGKQVEKVIADNAIPAAGAIAAALAIGGGAAVVAIVGICAVLAAVALALKAAADAIDNMGDASLTQTLDTGVKAIENVPGIPWAIKIMALRTLFLTVFEKMQGKQDLVAISYAVMDGHDYLDRSCYGNAESIEIFFDAQKPDVYCAYIDAVLAFETAQQEQSGRFTAGYISLRYILGSRALIAPSQFADTVVIEIAGIRDSSGTIPFIMNAVMLARNPMFAGCFHWGQFNPLTRPEVESLYDKAPEKRLTRWRQSLRTLTQNGVLDGFSSQFTRDAGLEPF